MLNVSPPEQRIKPARTSGSFEGKSALPVQTYTADFLITLSFLGDIVMIVLGLSLGFWIRFRSGWITFGVETPNLTYYDYAGLFAVGTSFLLAAFGFLGVYDSRKLLRPRQV